MVDSQFHVLALFALLWAQVVCCKKPLIGLYQCNSSQCWLDMQFFYSFNDPLFRRVLTLQAITCAAQNLKSQSSQCLESRINQLLDYLRWNLVAKSESFRRRKCGHEKSRGMRNPGDQRRGPSSGTDRSHTHSHTLLICSNLRYGIIIFGNFKSVMTWQLHCVKDWGLSQFEKIHKI